MRVGCLLITHLLMKLELNRYPNLMRESVILYEDSGRNAVVVDYSKNIRDVTLGMPVRAVLQRYPDATLIRANPGQYSRVLTRMTDLLNQISPNIERNSLGCTYIDLDGINHIPNNEAKIIARILDAAPEYLYPRVGVAEGKFPSYVAALSTQTGRATLIPQKPSHFLRSFSVDLLPVPSQTKVSFHKLGMHTLGELADQSPGAMRARFGLDGILARNLALGIDSSPLIADKFMKPVTEYVSLPFPSASSEGFLIALQTLFKRAYSRTSMKNRYAHRISIKFGMANDLSWFRNITVKDPVGSAESAFHTIRNILDNVKLPSPIVDMTLTLSGFTKQQGVQAKIFRDDREPKEERWNTLNNLNHQIHIRLGRDQGLHHIAKVNPNHPLPEMRFIQVPLGFADTNTEIVKPLNMPKSINIRQRNGRPSAIYVHGKSTHNTALEDTWKINLWWMPYPVHRIYYVLRKDSGGLVTVFHDIVRGKWYRQNY